MAIRSRTTGGNALSSRSSDAVLTRGYLSGGPELAAKLQALEKGLRDELLVEVTSAGAEVFAAEWRSRVLSTFGRGPGVAHYAEAIDFLAKPGKRGATAVVGLKNVPVDNGEAHPREYASRFEFGSTKRSLSQFKSGVTHAGRARGAQPTLRPAFEGSKARALDAMGVKVRELIERAI